MTRITMFQPSNDWSSCKLLEATKLTKMSSLMAEEGKRLNHIQWRQTSNKTIYLWGWGEITIVSWANTLRKYIFLAYGYPISRVTTIYEFLAKCQTFKYSIEFCFNLYDDFLNLLLILSILTSFSIEVNRIVLGSRQYKCIILTGKY